MCFYTIWAGNGRGEVLHPPERNFSTYQLKKDSALESTPPIFPALSLLKDKTKTRLRTQDLFWRENERLSAGLSSGLKEKFGGNKLLQNSAQYQLKKTQRRTQLWIKLFSLLVNVLKMSHLSCTVQRDKYIKHLTKKSHQYSHES